MITKLYSVPDWEKALNDIGYADAPAETDIEARITKQLSRGRVTYVPQEPGELIERGCRVTIRTNSALPKFNKEKTTLTVGSGLYDRTVEDKLVGMTAGESAAVNVKGEQVEFTVLSAERKHIPKFTDDMVKELGIEGTETLEAYRAYIAEKIRTDYASVLAKRILDTLLEAAVMDEPADKDIEKVIDLEYEPLRFRFQLDKLTPEEWANDLGRAEMRAYYEQIYPDVAIIFGSTSKESFYEMRREPAKQTIRNCLVLHAVLSDETDPTEEGKAEKKLMDEFTDRIKTIVFGG